VAPVAHAAVLAFVLVVVARGALGAHAAIVHNLTGERHLVRADALVTLAAGQANVLAHERERCA